MQDEFCIVEGTYSSGYCHGISPCSLLMSIMARLLTPDNYFNRKGSKYL